jgi:hypothetical protein
LYQTVGTHFVHPFLKDEIKQIVKNCNTCLGLKLPGAGYDLLPPGEATLIPWYEVAVHLIGLWTILVHGAEIEFFALTCIETISNIVEVVQIENKSAAHVGMLFENHWLGI